MSCIPLFGSDCTINTSSLQEMWPPGSADTVCPRPPLMTQVGPYSILLPELRRGRDETYRRCELMTLEVVAVAADAGLRSPYVQQL